MLIEISLVKRDVNVLVDHRIIFFSQSNYHFQRYASACICRNFFLNNLEERVGQELREEIEKVSNIFVLAILFLIE